MSLVVSGHMPPSADLRDTRRVSKAAPGSFRDLVMCGAAWEVQEAFARLLPQGSTGTPSPASPQPE